jgi:hypothetical protein
MFLFDACSPVESGQAYRFTFHESGAWRYHDHLFPEHTGVIRVESVAGYQPPVLHQVFSALVRAPVLLSGLYNKLFLPEETNLIAGKYTLQDIQSSKDYRTEDALSAALDDLEVLRMVNQLGLREALERVFAASEGESLSQCHLATHYVGRAGFDLMGIKVFEQCDTYCQSGCYHGATERLAVSKSSTELLKALEELCAKRETAFDRYQCFHGIGHGFILYAEHALPTALDACRGLAEKPAQEACYGGVFMENVANSGIKGGVVEPQSAWLSATDPHYPCTLFSDDGTVQTWCYQLQLGWMYVVNRGDVEKTIDSCLSAPEGMVGTCFKSFGRFFTAKNLRDPEQAEHFCSLIPRTYYEDCIRGASKLSVDFFGADTTGQAVAFCKGFSDSTAKSICYDRYTQSLPDLFLSKETQGILCAMFEGPYAEQCIQKLK